MPFEIPESWELCRLGSICKLLNADKLDGSEYPYLHAKYLRGKAEPQIKDKGRFVKKGTDVILVDGENSGEVFLIPEDGYMGSTFRVLYIPNELNKDYVLKLIELYKEPLRKSKKGAAIPHLNKEIFNNIFIGIPPFDEQKRIVNQIKDLMPFILKYEKLEEKLTNLNENFPIEIKKSILQEAIQGKLVPQNPNDESASILLKRIREEKEQLIKSKKIKRNKNESIIYRENNHFYEKFTHTNETNCVDEELPFKIPDSWEWTRLDNIGVYKKGPFGSALTKSMFVPKSNNSVKVYEQKNAIQKNETLGDYYITKEYYETKMKGFTVESGDIIVSCAGTIGETYVLPDNIELGIINQALMRMNIVNSLNLDYFLIYFDYILKKSAIEHSKGSAIKNIPPFKIFKRLLIPIPPMGEQNKIVLEIKKLESKIDKLNSF